MGSDGAPLELEFSDLDARQQRKAAAASPDSLPDVALIEASMILVVGEEGALRDLNDLMPDAVESCSENFFELLFDLGRYNGGFSPYVSFSPVILCNTDMFAEAGIEYPTTWSELITATEMLNMNLSRFDAAP